MPDVREQVLLAGYTTLGLGGPARRFELAATEDELTAGPDPAGPGVLLTVAAGEDWDGVVAACVAQGLAGLECLSGIPGLAGATPIQNVGAYGQEVSDTITGVRAYDRREQKISFFKNEQCGFAYRTSVFRGDDRYAVLDVTFRLGEPAPIRYAELAAAVGPAPTLGEV